MERCLACEADSVGTAFRDLRIMPPKIVKTSLELPVVRIRNETMPHRVISDVQPFNVIAVTISKLVVPKTSLPNGLVFCKWPEA